jgi:hypothetical protein
MVVGGGKGRGGGCRRQWQIWQGWEERWDEPVVCVCQEGPHGVFFGEIRRGAGRWRSQLAPDALELT